MPLAGRVAPPNKRKKLNRIITDLSHVTQDEFDSEPEASEFDLGTKMKTPKDIMLEELSLMGNKGSKMFRMRQKRVERFIHENNPDLFSNESMARHPEICKMPGSHVQLDLPIYKSFNRSAVPFGGFEKANQLLTFQLPDIEATKEEPEPAMVYQSHISSRPSFNRTPIGWMGSSEPTSLHLEMDSVPFDGETDDL
ncbi:myozenin-1-like [Aplochiton taeniatus]